MFHVHYSNRLEVLAEQLAGRLASPAGSPLAPEPIVVQNMGLGRWLSLHLAERLGVAANLRLALPAGFIWECFSRLLPDLSPEQAFTGEVLSWRVMGALETAPGGGPLGHYLARRDTAGRFELAERLAGCFEQYLIYRPDWIEEWEAGGSGGPWQVALWRQLVASAGGEHWVAVQRRFQAALAAGKLDAGRLPGRVCLLGVSALSPGYLHTLHALAELMDVHLFALNPCREYWGDIVSRRSIGRRSLAAGGEALYLETGNSLLAGLGAQGRDLIDGLQELGAVESEHYVEPGEATLLARLQSDILHLRDRSDRAEDRPAVAPDDTSLRIHSCHSPQREVEVLQDQLLDLLARDPSLSPADVVVMTPDIEAYAPYIEAVFDSPERQRRLPFGIADRGLPARSRLIEAFFHVLELPAGRFEADRVASLLEVGAIRARFGLEERDLELTHHWIRETGIRWGIDGASRAREGLPASPEHSWRAGLERLLLGYALPDTADGLFLGLAPYGDIEGDAARVLGRWISCLEVLFCVPERLGSERPPAAWADALLDLCGDLFAVEESEEPELQALRDALEALRREAAGAGYGRAVPLALIVPLLRRKLEAPMGAAGFLDGGLTFCALVPMRSVPFRVVALLGMSEGAFPRLQHPLGFDLMAESPRRGDRNRRDEDRYLFLEALLAARERLLISHVGQDVRDNSTLPPSVLVSELLDAIDLNYALPGGQSAASWLCVQHPLQPFSRRYFDGSRPELFSYDAALCRAAASGRAEPAAPRPLLAARLPEADPSWRQVELDQLLRFFAHPARALLQVRLGVYLERSTAELESHEPFGLDYFGVGEVRDELLARRLAGVPPERSLTLLRAQGRLPHGNVGRAVLRQEEAQVERFAGRLQGLLEARPVGPCAIDLRIGEFQLSGSLDGLSEAGYTGYRPEPLRARHWVALWLRHLCLCAAQTAVPARSTWVAAEEVVVLSAPPQPLAELEALLAIYWQGLHRPLPFFPRSALDYATVLAGGRGNPLAKARDTWLGSDFGASWPESGDPYHSLLFSGTADDLDEEFAALAKRFFGAALACREVAAP